MSTSGSVDWSISRDNIIGRAVRLLGQVQSGESVSTEENSDAALALNGMIKRWQGKGLKLWKVAECVLFLKASQYVYQIGGSSPSDHCGYRRVSDTAVKTEVATAVSSGDSSVVVDSISGIAASDNIGLVQDDDTIHWTTASGAPSGSTITLAAVTTDTAAVDNHVYAYTTDIPRPLRIVNAQFHDSDENDIPVQLISRQEYQDLPTKTTTGSSVVQVYYDPQRDNGYVHVWPAPSDSTGRLYFTAYLPLEDFDAAGNTPDFPQEWYDALCFNLAVALAPEYGVTGEEKIELAAQAKAYLNEVSGWDMEPESIYFQPDAQFA